MARHHAVLPGTRPVAEHVGHDLAAGVGLQQRPARGPEGGEAEEPQPQPPAQEQEPEPTPPQPQRPPEGARGRPPPRRRPCGDRVRGGPAARHRLGESLDHQRRPQRPEGQQQDQTTRGETEAEESDRRAPNHRRPGLPVGPQVARGHLRRLAQRARRGHQAGRPGAAEVRLPPVEGDRQGSRRHRRGAGPRALQGGQAVGQDLRLGEQGRAEPSVAGPGPGHAALRVGVRPHHRFAAGRRGGRDRRHCRGFAREQPLWPQARAAHPVLQKAGAEEVRGGEGAHGGLDRGGGGPGGREASGASGQRQRGAPHDDAAVHDDGPGGGDGPGAGAAGEALQVGRHLSSVEAASGGAPWRLWQSLPVRSDQA
mmetsp:Transcript_9194/g.24416  ORF Transcript_9194/g.24416 Transcript_9194/m.24416 type:complete len:368 (+) Transcript_9194:620-1723(+)